MVSRLKLERIKMNMPIEMNMPIAAAMDSELRVLTDNELDDVNGGFFFLAYIAAAAVGVGIGYVLARGVGCILDGHLR
jgi:lactobin A/cerein 7B family class IIb bacteriocin